MRIKLKFDIDNGELFLPFSYYHYLQAILYKSMGDNISIDYHTKVGVKNIAFSNLFGEYSINKKSKELIFKNHVTWYITSTNDELIQKIANNFTKQRTVSIFHQNITLSELEISFETVKKNTILIETLSPITVHETILDDSGKNKTKYFTPNDLEFAELINQNLCSKKESLGIPTSINDKIDIVALSDIKKVIVTYKNFIIEGYQGIFVLKGSIDDLNLLYNAGIGCKNTHGFGMFRIIEND